MFIITFNSVFPSSEMSAFQEPDRLPRQTRDRSIGVRIVPVPLIFRASTTEGDKLAATARAFA